MFQRQHIQRQFDRAAPHFDSADFVHAATRDGLLARLEPLIVEASTVLDLGCATGAANRALEKRFKASRVIAVDIAHQMLTRARAKKAWLSRTRFVQADACQLPLANESVDVVFSNLLLPWVSLPDRLFSEVARTLRKGGVFAFATLGPDSFREIRDAWGRVDSGEHALRFADMHDIGDGLVNAGLRDPVLDVDRLSISYSSSQRLFDDLTSVGARNALASRRSGLTGKRQFEAMTRQLADRDKPDAISLNLELVYGHCWGAGPKLDPTNYRIDASGIPIRGR
jgi:malonyl-CoA O-methyltransferase